MLKFCFLAAVFLLAGGVPSSQAQTLYLDPPRQHLSNRPYRGVETITISLMVDFGIESAVGWGTDISLGNTEYMDFVPDFGGEGVPFRSTQAFFNTDFSDYSDADPEDGDANISLNFLNFNFGETFNQAGQVTLGQFQVRIKGEPGYPDFALVNDPIANFWRNTSISLSPVAIPPFGSAVQDVDGNNLIQFASGAIITTRPATPEPSAWLVMGCGAGIGWLFRRRRIAAAK